MKTAALYCVNSGWLFVHCVAADVIFTDNWVSVAITSVPCCKLGATIGYRV